MDEKSYCGEAEDENVQVISGDEAYHLPYKELLRATSSKYLSRARRILNVAMAQGAVKFLVRSNAQYGVMMDGQKQPQRRRNRARWRIVQLVRCRRIQVVHGISGM